MAAIKHDRQRGEQCAGGKSLQAPYYEHRIAAQRENFFQLGSAFDSSACSNKWPPVRAAAEPPPVDSRKAGATICINTHPVQMHRYARSAGLLPLPVVPKRFVRAGGGQKTQRIDLYDVFL